MHAEAACTLFRHAPFYGRCMLGLAGAPPVPARVCAPHGIGVQQGGAMWPGWQRQSSTECGGYLPQRHTIRPSAYKVKPPCWAMLRAASPHQPPTRPLCMRDEAIPPMHTEAFNRPCDLAVAAFTDWPPNAGYAVCTLKLPTWNEAPLGVLGPGRGGRVGDVY